VGTGKGKKPPTYHRALGGGRGEEKKEGSLRGVKKGKNQIAEIRKRLPTAKKEGEKKKKEQGPRKREKKVDESSRL